MFTNVSWSGGIAPTFNLAAGKQDMVQIRVIGSDIMGWPVSMGRLPLVQALPAAPAGITVVAGVGQNTVNVAAVTAYPPVSGYNIYAGSSSGGESAVPVSSSVRLPWIDAGLPVGVIRFYKVAAVNSVGVGAFSAEASGIPVAAGAVPAMPVGVTAVGGQGQVTINAAPVSATPGVTGYMIFRGTSAGTESSTPIATNVALPFVDSSVQSGTQYYYTIAATNNLGTGSSSLEVSAQTVGNVSARHYASFTASDAVIYASPNIVFNPAASSFDMQIFVRMASWANSVYGGSGETCLFGCWDINAANRLWRLGLTASGAVRASWAAGVGSDPTAISSVVIPTAGGSDLWIRAVVAPVAGTVSFYTSPDGTNWQQLGAQQTASGGGAVYVPATLPYLVIGANGSGGSSGNTAEQFAGRFYEARLYINGILVTDPSIGPSGTTDSKGIVYSSSPSVAVV